MGFIDMQTTEQPKVSIGLPVHNGEQFIHRRLNSILEQTFSNFELIISDNASTDSTPNICEEYLKKDKRIRYFRHEKKMRPMRNFKFVLEQAKYDYFVWVAVDDYWHPDFLAKNIKNLLSKKKLVCSISKIQEFSVDAKNLESVTKYSMTTKIIKKLRTKFMKIDMHTLSGSYEKKVRDYLKNSMCDIIYGVHRTANLRNGFVDREFNGNDWAIDLNILKFGDIQVIDEVLLYKYEEGLSSSGIINLTSNLSNLGIIAAIFPYYPLTFWCLKHLGIKIFLRNIDYFIWLNCAGGVSLILDLLRLLEQKISSK